MPVVSSTFKSPARLFGFGSGSSSLRIAHTIESRPTSAAFYVANVQTTYRAADTPAAKNVVVGIRSGASFGSQSFAPVGSFAAIEASNVVQNNGDSSNEHAALFAAVRYDVGTGYTVTSPSGGPGRCWLMDTGVHGPIGLQPDLLNGITVHMNNHYNGSPASGASAAIWVSSRKGSGPAIDATHQSAETYPMDVGIGVVGTSGGGVTRGYEKAIRVGGTGSGWEPSSRFGTGIEVADYESYGIRVTAKKSGSSAIGVAVPVDAGPVLIGPTSLSSASNQVELGGSGLVVAVTTDNKLGFFGKAPALQQTGGSATASGTYGATEQGMLQKAYDALRTFGLLS